jgi:hypothetical protein
LVGLVLDPKFSGLRLVTSRELIFKVSEGINYSFVSSVEDGQGV